MYTAQHFKMLTQFALSEEYRTVYIIWTHKLNDEYLTQSPPNLFCLHLTN